MNRRQAIGSVIATSLAANFSNLFASSENNLEKAFKLQLEKCEHIKDPILFYYDGDACSYNHYSMKTIFKSELGKSNLVSCCLKEQRMFFNNPCYDGIFPMLKKKS